MVNFGFAYLCFMAVMIVMWWVATYTKNKKCNGILMCFLDILPAFLPLFMPMNSVLGIFIILILYAIISIRVSVGIGGATYLVAYLGLFITMLCLGNSMSWLGLFVGLILVTALVLYMFFKTKVDKWTKIGATIYGYLAIVPLICMGFMTKNIGFFCLVIGDITLALIQVLKNPSTKKDVHFISNSFFYLGIMLSALSISG